MQSPAHSSHRLTLANILVVLAIPCVAWSAFWGLHTLLDPLSSLTPTPEEANFPSVPKTVAQIEGELDFYGLYLGDRLDLSNGEVLYAVMERDFNGMQELRVYQKLADQRLVLHRVVPITGLDEFAVRSPVQKFSPAKLNPNSRRRWVALPLTKLQVIPAPPQWQEGGVWLAATGTIDGILYGRILFYDQSPQKNLKILAEWSSPANEIPQWRQFLPRPQAQLVVNHTQHQDPKFQVFVLEAGSKLQLRPVNLPKFPKIQGLAEAGLWSLAKAHLDTIRAERMLANTSLSESEQQAYELVAAHSQLLEQQMWQTDRQQPDNIGDRTYFYLLNGLWHSALELVEQNPKAYPQISAMLAQKYAHIWLRVRAAQQFDPEVNSQPAIKTWGALASIPRLGFRRAEMWLKQANADTPANLSLLQKLDLQPLGIEPTQIVGAVRVLGDELPNQRWLLPPPVLSQGQAWFTVDVDLIQNRQNWIASPFPQIANRSSLFLWRALGLERNKQIRITTSSSRQVFSLIVRSLWVSEQGKLQLLAEGDQAIAELIAQESHPALATTGLLPVMGQSLSLPISYLPEPLQSELLSNLYAELQALSPPNISLADFQAIAQRWQFQSLDFDGDGQGELFLTLTREQVNAGDRPYPLAIVFNQQGKILFSDIDLKNRGRRWLYNFTTTAKQPIPMLTETQGRFELWQIKPSN